GVFERFGFQPLETPIIEAREVLVGAKAGETSQRIFSWRHEEEDAELGLRFDLTVPLARFVAAHPELRRPFKRYQVGPVFRVDKPGAGRFREFLQFDIDTVGSRSMLADAEILGAMSEALRALGLPAHTIRWNHRGVLNAALRRAKIEPSRAAAVIRILDKEDKIGIEGVRGELGEGRTDPESGAPIPGLGLPEQQIQALREFLQLQDETDEGLVEKSKEFLAGTKGAEAALKEIDELRAQLEVMGCAERVRFSPNLARGMDYYTGPIFEATLDELPDYGSIMGGGRYDELVSRFSGEQLPGVGASIGVDRLLAALDQLESRKQSGTVTEVLVTTMDRKLILTYQALVRELREAGLNAEIYLNPKARLGDQLKYASFWQIPYALIVGEDELKEEKVTIKDLEEGARAASGMEDRAEWVEQRPGQFSLDRAKLVQTLKKLLGHGS
ncbi:MAG TPA: histidine--tRNA ligase, partial [Candidatus Krumholzibacteria bacterium]|nr:histidine--tRNA ligase [Candidatus Krumholzibacteria bacterium]